MNKPIWNKRTTTTAGHIPPTTQKPQLFPGGAPTQPPARYHHYTSLPHIYPGHFPQKHCWPKPNMLRHPMLSNTLHIAGTQLRCRSQNRSKISKTFFSANWSFPKSKNLHFFKALLEVSSHDQIKMTKFSLEYDWKILHRQTLTLEHDRKIYANGGGFVANCGIFM